MPLTDISRLSDDANIWVFGITPAIDDTEALLARVDAFLREWAAHGSPVLSARELRDGRFLVIAADKEAEKSGCSIDRLFGLVRALERDFGVSMLDPQNVFYRDSTGIVCDAKRSTFREVANDSTMTFDTTAPTLGALRSGAWERPARESWHAALLRRTA
jgi:hypothetical protein